MFEDIRLVSSADFAVIDIAFGIIEIMTGFLIDTPYGAHHFRSEQNILVWDHVQQQIDTRLVIDAGVKIDIIQQ